MSISRLAYISILLASTTTLYGSQAPPGQAPHEVDLSLKGDLTGDGRIFRVEWYHRTAEDAASPGSFIIGCSVRGTAENSPIIAQWEASQPSPTFAPDLKLDELWPVPESGGRIITIRVSYGVKATELTALRFDGRRLRVVGHWRETGFTLTRLGPDKQLIVIQTSGSSGNFPTIFAWNGSEFKDVSREFPQYYANWAAPFVKEIRNPEPLFAGTVASDCELALKAFDYAGQPQVARQVCLEARKRVSTGFAIIPDQDGESPQDFDQERSLALETISRALGERKGSRSEAARVFESPR